MTDLMELASRVEAGEGADRELDADVFCALGLAPFVEGAYDAYRAPAYTASLDAAMSLVPQGWGWNVSQPNDRAIASGLLKERTPVHGEVQYGCDHRYAVAAATPALALTAACLRARAHQGTAHVEQ